MTETNRTDRPCAANGYLQARAARLLSSYAHWTGKDLLPAGSLDERARLLFHAPFAVLSHDTAPDPILNYANETALALFELAWDELIALPSRRTAEAAEQSERKRFLAAVAQRGYIDDYRGIRVTRSGRRFMIEQATVWNLRDEAGAYCGQAAMFSEWKYQASL
jgi:hypothetical protein